jgi:hypothetical protein
MADATYQHGEQIVLDVTEATQLESVYGAPINLGDVISLEVVNKGTQLATVTSRMWDHKADVDSTLQVCLRVI